jgi:hypothetical protein
MAEEPKPLPLEVLQEKARADGLALAREVFGGEVLVDTGEATVEWNARDLRFIYDDVLTVWKRFTTFEVIVDDGDEVVGFVDEDKWSDCRAAPLADERAIELLRETGLFRGRLTVVGRSAGPEGCVELLVRSDTHPQGLVRRVLINPVTCAVIAVEPVSATGGSA